MNKVSNFTAIRLRLASPKNILDWSHGEVVKPETINYRTQKPEKDGLFSEQIFGPEKDWECYCGKYKRIRYKGIVCDKCGVEVTRAIVRRERMGHIELASPVSHIWFLRGVPSKIGMILDMSVQELEKVIYFASYVVMNVDEKARENAIDQLNKEYKLKLKSLTNDIEKTALREQKDAAMADLNSLSERQIISEIKYQSLSLKYAEVFQAGIGGEAVRKMLESIDLPALRDELIIKVQKATDLTKKNIARRLRLVESMIRAKINPEWMIITVLPVLPPDLRPMVALDGGKYATSDLNDLYRRVINRNNRLKKLIELNAPEVITRNEKRMLQEAVDALIDNSARRGQGPVMASTGQRRTLRSLADMLKGKQGRFRQNLLGKRVDYSGRSVIVVGPELKINQCGLPKRMALELFKPFVISKLVEREYAHNIRGASRLIEQETDEVWGILEEVIQGKHVLLNRAPTLHRLGIQAFSPVLIEGSAIQVHPAVCLAFNADFDGDQMAVHLPLTDLAQDEAKNIMLSSTNMLKPATGDPITIPTQDIVLGCYWMAKLIDGGKGEGKIFGNFDDAILAWQFNELDVRAKIKLLWTNKDGKKELIETSVGRILFNAALPEEQRFINTDLSKKTLLSIVADLIENYGQSKSAVIIDRIKTLGFEFASLSASSWSMADLNTPVEKKKIISETEHMIDTIHQQYLDGLLTFEERRFRIIESWFSAIDKIAKEVKVSLNEFGSVYSMIASGARGSWGQVSQMMGMKGLVTNPVGEVIELPIKSSFKEGFNCLEYFISTHGARKGTTDTALRTSTAGYLTRRLVDVAQDLIIKEEDCGTKEGVNVYRKDGEEFRRSLASRIFGRYLLEDIKNADNTVIAKKGVMIDKKIATLIDKSGIEKIKVRSVIECQAREGLCQKCYGYDLGKNQIAQMGSVVGVVTAQAIGEPGTQLTMKTFHTGGVAATNRDITHGLLRVEEIFECRPPKGEVPISEIDGEVVEIEEKEKEIIVHIQPSGLSKEDEDLVQTKYSIPRNVALRVKKGHKVTKGQQLAEGHLDLKKIYKISGKEDTMRYIIKEVQNIYAAQGEGIADKHIEMIIRQMLSRVRVKDPGDTNLLIGDVVEYQRVLRENDKAKEAGKKISTGTTLLMGISKVSLTTESWLSAASFQETAKILIAAAVEGKIDHLRGLKENVILGKLIPAGTGYQVDQRTIEENEEE